jgi:hypothetical protein
MIMRACLPTTQEGGVAQKVLVPDALQEIVLDPTSRNPALQVIVAWEGYVFWFVYWALPLVIARAGQGTPEESVEWW